MGDAALDLLLVLTASSLGLDARRTDALRQSLLRNAALGGGAAGTRTGGRRFWKVEDWFKGEKLIECAA